jgi:hypothetical protein
MDCFSEENGRYIAGGNEAGSKGSESPFKYHLATGGGDKVLAQL